MRVLIILALLFLAAPASAMRPFITKGTDGAPALIPPVSDCNNNYALVANTARTITWPVSCGTPASVPANYAVFSASAPYWIGASGQMATVPTGDTTNGTGSALNPGQLYRYADTTFSIISATDQEISVSFWQ